MLRLMQLISNPTRVTSNPMRVTSNPTRVKSNPTRVTSNSSIIIDHIVINVLERVSQQDFIDVELSDHQLIYCTMKIQKIKICCHKQR